MTTRGEGITRREALRKGTLGGLGLIWAAPSMERLVLSSQHAQTASPVTTTEGTTPTTEGTTPTTGAPTTTDGDISGTTITDGNGEPPGAVSETTAEDKVLATTIVPEARDEVEAEQLPFTGFNAEHLLPVAGGLIATGAAAVRLAKERQAKTEGPEEAT